jgi:hypothetical protein
VKTIKNRKAIYTHVLVTALLLTLLLSLLTGIVVAPKPEKPGRPGKPVETWDLTIRIGIGDDNDIVLAESDYQDQDGFYLFAEDVPCSGGLWNFPDEPKGKSNKGRYVSAQFSSYKLYNETTGEWIGDDCGTYYLDSVPGKNSDGGDTYMNGFDHDNPDYHIVEVDIGHQVDPMGQDYWWFGLIWTLRQPDPDNWESYFFKAWTDKDGNPEVTPPEGNVLTVVFEETDPNQSNAMIFSRWDDANLDGLPDEYHWMGTVSFTVEITREPHVA